MKKVLQFTVLFGLLILALTAGLPYARAMVASVIDSASTFQEMQLQNTIGDSQVQSREIHSAGPSPLITSILLVVYKPDGTIQIVDPNIHLGPTDNPAFNGLLPTGGSVAGVAYVLDSTNQTEVVSIDANGTRKLSFIQNPTSYGLAVWQGSPSTQPRLAWGTQPMGSTLSSSLQISTPDGATHETLLTQDTTTLPLQLMAEFWSADGQWLYFSKEPMGLGGYILYGGASNLYKINIITKEVQEVIPLAPSSGPQACLDAISGDYRYVADHCSQKTITIRDLTSGGTTTIKPPREVSPVFRTLGSARFSPDGNRLAFALARGDQNNEQGWVAVSDGTSGGSKLVLTGQMGTYYTIAGWLNDQTLLVQSTNSLDCTPFCNSELWTVGIDGKNLQKAVDGSLLAMIKHEAKTYSSDGGQFSLQYPSTAIFYENRRISVDGVVSPAQNTIAIQDSEDGGPVLSLTYYKLPRNTSLRNFVRSENECAGLASLTGQSFFLQGHKALLFPDTSCGPYGTTFIYTTTGNMGYRFTIETHENYSAATHFIDPILKSFQTHTAVDATPTATPIPCNLAHFIKDVTVKDDSFFTPDEDFIKTWRLENTGTCTWTWDYDLVFKSGDLMDGPSTVSLDKMVKPGETIDISVDLTAPKKAGEYTGYWVLRDDAGRIFGIGASGQSAFWVKVKVVNPTTPTPVGTTTPEPDGIFDFFAKSPSAVWSNTTKKLPWGDPDDDSPGVATRTANYNLEDTKTYSNVLITFPQQVTDGLIQGVFPIYTVRSGDHFKALVALRQNCTDGKVKFQLKTREAGTDTVVGEWLEACDGLLTTIDKDLTFLAGKTVKFILLVSAEGDWVGDYASWVNPRIVR